MKEWFDERFMYAKVNFRVLIIKTALLIAGMMVMALGIALYIPTGLGKSQVDFTVFTFIYVFRGKFVDDNSAMQANGAGMPYSTMLTWFYVMTLLVSGIMGLVATLNNYKKNKVKAVWIGLATIVATDLAITFIFPYMVNFFSVSSGSGGVFGIQAKLTSWFATFDSANGESSSAGIRSWMFVLAFIVFCLGIALWVKSTWAPGPYNSICTQFMALTKLNYTISRIVCDLIIVAPALVAIWIVPGESATYFFKNFAIATIAFVFVAGPFVSLMLKGMDKVIDYKKLTKDHNQNVKTTKVSK